MTDEATLPAADIFAEAARVLGAAREQGVLLRLIGGVAIRLRAGDVEGAGLAREYKDIDLVAPRGSSRRIEQLLSSLGYEPNREFNALNGTRRLQFYDVSNRRQLDVFIGSFEMCHALPIAARLELEPDTLPLAELLLTKLQVVELNDRDRRDILALLLRRDVADEDGDTINSGYVARLCADDWGLWRTCKLNVERIRAALDEFPLAVTDKETVEARLHRLWHRIEAEPKPLKWRVRDRVGDRLRWYEIPEEVR